MFKRFFTPLTLVNQLALIVLLSTLIGVASMMISARLINGVQGSAHAINQAGSLRMQSYRLLAAIPVKESDQALFDEMQRTVFSPELQLAAERDGQVKQLASLQQYWLNYLAPDIRSAQSQSAVVNDLTGFVDRINQLVTVFDHTTEERIAHVVWMHRLMAVFMALLFIFTVFWLRTRLRHPWRQLLRLAEAISHRDFT